MDEFKNSVKSRCFNVKIWIYSNVSCDMIRTYQIFIERGVNNFETDLHVS